MSASALEAILAEPTCLLVLFVATSPQTPVRCGLQRFCATVAAMMACAAQHLKDLKIISPPILHLSLKMSARCLMSPGWVALLGANTSISRLRLPGLQIAHSAFGRICERLDAF